MGRRLQDAAIGLLAGLLATATMILTFAALRTWAGVSPPPEAIPDRFAPTLDIPTFFSLFGRFGGYNGLKRFGITSGLAGLILVGVLVGILYALVATSAWARRGERWRGWPRRGVIVLGLVVAGLWLGLLAVLWPVLDANYRGLSPTPATLVTAGAYLLVCLLYAAVLLGSHRWLTPAAARPHPAPAAPPAGPIIADGPPLASSAPVGRRAVVAGAATVALALPSFALIQRLNADATFPYDGTPYSGPGVQPLTPNDKFYTVTKNVVDPNVSQNLWALQVDGLVAQPHTYRFPELAALSSITQESTLMCISNQIGAGLFSNAIWGGVPLRDLLRAASPAASAVEVRLHAADGYTDTFAIERALDPTTLVAVTMNGEPLPRRHGYPARIIVPGLYGEKNVKWVTRIEVIDHDGKGFYEQQGWGPNFEIPTRSDIFAPRWRRDRGDHFVEAFVRNEPATIRGRAFAGARGIRAVEFSADDGATWRPATLDYPGSDLTWTFWSAEWLPIGTGEFTLLSRATDGTGAPQSSERRGIVPEGATGYHRVGATVV